MRDRSRITLGDQSLGGAGLHIGVPQGPDVDARGAVRRLDGDVDDDFVGGTGQPAYFHRTLRIIETGCQPEALDSGRDHQPRIGFIHQSGDVDGGVEQCHGRRLGQADIGDSAVRRGPKRVDRPVERQTLHAPRCQKLGRRTRFIAVLRIACSAHLRVDGAEVRWRGRQPSGYVLDPAVWGRIVRRT